MSWRDEYDHEVERFCAEAHAPLVAALAHQFGDRWLAEDLAQEALVRACDRWGKVRRLDSPVGWAFRVGVNLGRSRFRRRAAERRARARRGPEPSVHHDADTADRLAVDEAMAELTHRQREAVVLRYFLGMTAGQAAATVGSTEGAVRVQTHRAIGRMREVLGEQLRQEGSSDGT